MYRPLNHRRSVVSFAVLVAILAAALAAAPSVIRAATGGAPAAVAAATPAAASKAPAAEGGAPSAAAATADAKPAKKALFRGVVQDDKLQPLAGATVTIVVVPERDEDRGGPGMRMFGGGGGRFAMQRGGGRMNRRDQRPSFFTAKSDSAGAFSVEAEEPARGAASYNLRVDAPGFAPTIVEKVKPGEGVSTLFLKKGVSASGVVADLASGSPVPDAEVLVIPDEAKGFRDFEDPKRFAAVARTGRDGTFTAANVNPSFYSFRVTAQGRALYETSGKPVGDGPPSPLIFYLEPGFDVTGRVLDPAGKPAAGIDVYAQAPRRGPTMLRFATRSGFATPTAVTEKDGKFTLKGVSTEAKFTVEAAPRDYAPASADIPVSRAGALVTGIELKLEKGTTLKAKFTDADQKPITPVVNATLTYRDPKTRKVLRVMNRMDKDAKVSPAGELAIEKLPTGTATVELSLEGFKDVTRKDVAIGKDAKAADLGTIVLDRGKKIAGKVVDADGKAIALARVSASSFSPGKAFGSAETKSDKEGKFTLSGLDPDGAWSVEATATGYSSAKQEDVKPEGDPLELKLTKAGTLKGRVVFGDPPRPLTNFTVEADAKEEGSGGGAGMFRMMRSRGNASRQSDPRGAFTLDNLTPGSYTLLFKADGLLDLSKAGVEVKSGETADIGDIALEAGGSLHGRVQSQPEGLPVAGAAVRVKSAGLFDMRNMMGSSEGTVLTDLSGRFEMRGLAAGTITLQVEPANYAKKEVANVTVDPASPGDEIIVNVGKGGRIEGIVMGDDGRPKPNSIVSVMGGMADFNARQTGITDEQGHYAIEFIPSGTYNVSNLSINMGDDEEDDNGATAPRRFGGLDSVSTEVKEGQTSTVNFGEKKIKVSGLVKRKQGESSGLIVVWTAMSAGTGGPMAAKIAPTDQTGHYEVTLSVPGEYNVGVGDQGMRGGSTIKVTVPDTSTFTYDISMPEGAISGRITAQDTGLPLSGVMVIAQATLAPDEKSSLLGRQGSRATSGDDGTYSLSGLKPGIYDMTFAKEGYGAELRHGVELKDAELSGTDLTLSKGIPFKVRVTNPSGAGVAGAIMMVAQDGQLLGGIGGLSQDDGTVELKSLKPGMYSFIAMTREYAPGVSKDVSVGGEHDSDTGVVQLSPGGGAKVTVQDGGKQPISGAKITIENLDSPEMSSAMEIASMMRGRASNTGADGVLPFERLPAGKYNVTVAKGDKTVTKSLTVEEGATAELTVKLE